VRARDPIGFPSVFRRGLLWLGWNHAILTLVEMWVICYVLLSLHRDVAPQLFGMVVIRITKVKGSNLARLRIHRDPDLWLVFFFPTKLHL
jgi:hypothetical protein